MISVYLCIRINKVKVRYMDTYGFSEYHVLLNVALETKNGTFEELPIKYQNMVFNAEQATVNNSKYAHN